MTTRRQFLKVLAPGLVGLGIGRNLLSGSTFDVTLFGADPTSAADSTAAIVRAARALQQAGGGTLLFPRGLYRVFSRDAVRATPKHALANFSDLTGVNVVGEDAMLSVDWPFALGDFVDIFAFTSCTDVRVEGLEGVVPPYYPYSIDQDMRGPRLVRLLGACRNVAVDARLTRFLAGVAVTAPGLSSDEARTVGLHANLDLTECAYGLNCQFNGDGVTARITADRIGRSYFVYGVRDHDVVIRSRNNNRDDCVLSGYRGSSLENVRIDYQNVGSTSALPAAAGVALEAHWEGRQGEQGCAFRNLQVRYRVEYPQAGYPGYGLHVRKYDREGSYDQKDRGHRFEGVAISGYVSGSPGEGNQLPIRWDGRWGAGEVYGDWTLHDLHFEGTSWADVNLTSLKSGGLLQNVTSDNHIHLRGNPDVPIRVVNCRARSLSYSKEDRSRIEYIDSVITSDEYQSRINKRFVRTRVG